MNPPSIEELWKLYELQKKQNLSLRFVTLSRIKMKEGYEQFKLGNFHKSRTLTEESIIAQTENIKTIMSWQIDKSVHLAKDKQYLMERMINLVSSYILDENIWNETDSVNEVFIKIKKAKILNLEESLLSEVDKNYIIEKGISQAIVNYPNLILKGTVNLKQLAFNDSLKMLSDQEKLRVESKLLMYLVRNNKASVKIMTQDLAKNLADYHLRLAQITKLISTEENNNYYYEHLIDYYKYTAISSNTLSIFQERYAELDNTLKDYLKTDPSSRTIIRTVGSEKAQTLVFALRLTKNLDEKIEIIEKICEYYRQAKSYNSNRYEVYAKWFSVVKTINSASIKNLDDIKSLLKIIDKSLNKIAKDRDEAFLETNYPDIINTKNNIINVRAFLHDLIKKPLAPDIGIPVLNAAIILQSANEINLKDAFNILKRYVLREFNEGGPIDPIELSVNKQEQFQRYNDLIALGENRVIEFKQTWHYNVFTKTRDESVGVEPLIAIVAFLNTTGGTLLIGIEDVTRQIIGLESSDYMLSRKESSLSKRKDEFQQFVDNVIADRIGSSFFQNNINCVIYESNNKSILVVEVKPSNTIAYLDNEHIYVRGTSSSRLLKGRELEKFFANREAFIENFSD